MYKLLVLFFLFTALNASSFQLNDKSELKLSMEEIENGRNLNCVWDFYWNTTYADYQSNKTFAAAEKVIVPGDWTKLSHPDRGYGLFMLHIIIPKSNINNKLALFIPNVCNNFNVYINGVFYKSVGHFDTISETSVPDYFPCVVSFNVTSDTIELTFEISNFNYRGGGLYYNLAIGKENIIKLRFNRQLLFETFITGALFIMFFYFIIFYFMRQSNKATFYFALLCLVSTIRIVTTGQILIRQLFIPLEWEWLFKIELISIILIPTFGAWYLFQLLDETKFRRVLLLFTGISIMLCILTFVFNTYWASYIIPSFRLFALIQLLFLLFIVTRSIIIIKHPLSRLAGFGYVFVFIFSINDILYSKGIIHTLYLLPLGILVYVFVQAIVLTRKFTNAFDEVEDLSTKLQLVNRNQESIIDKRTHELENYNTIKDKIFSIICHDLRSPIATLSSVLSLAEQSDDKTVLELRSYFKGIKRSVDNLNLTIENLLVWSQNQINDIKLNPTWVNINKEIESVFALYNLVAIQKEIILINKINGSFDVWVDQAHFNLILRNLISNSLKFTNIGGSIVVSCSLHSANSIQLCISDNGIGIHPDKLKHIFDPQIHFTSYGTLNEKGTGLGLMLCKEYAEKNGGKIWIESTLGVGSKICIVLPMAIN
jgi:signal transduction histidine kinase